MSGNPPVVNLKDQRASELADEITELYGYITAATYEFLAKVREFDENGLWEGPGLVSCAHWLNWQCGIGMNAAREKVRVARALANLPKISEAFKRGEISFSKVRAITRVATPESEDYLLSIARNGTANHVEALVRGFRRAEHLSDAESAEHQFETRTFHYHWDEDGSLVFKGRLPAEVGAMLMKALQSAVDTRDVTAVTSEDENDGSIDSIAMKRADAIAEMAETYLAKGPAASSSADRYQVMLHVHPEDSSSHIEDGPHVSAETSKRICCDTSISRILVEDEEGEPLSIGRKSRVVPPAMRRALKARDKQCRFPGCTHRHYLDAHHMVHWADGGETSLTNLASLCRFHHRLHHEGGFTCEMGEDGDIVFRDPQGDRIPETGQFPRFSGNMIANLKEKLEDRFIDQQTIRPDWHGEVMDLGLAVGHLWEIERPQTLQR